MVVSDWKCVGLLSRTIPQPRWLNPKWWNRPRTYIMFCFILKRCTTSVFYIQFHQYVFGDLLYIEMVYKFQNYIYDHCRTEAAHLLARIQSLRTPNSSHCCRWVWRSLLRPAAADDQLKIDYKRLQKKILWLAITSTEIIHRQQWLWCHGWASWANSVHERINHPQNQNSSSVGQDTTLSTPNSIIQLLKIISHGY